MRKLRNKAGLQQPIESGKSNRFKSTNGSLIDAVRAPGQVQPTAELLQKLPAYNHDEDSKVTTATKLNTESVMWDSVTEQMLVTYKVLGSILPAKQTKN